MYSVKDGKIVEQGSHEELIRRGDEGKWSCLTGCYSIVVLHMCWIGGIYYEMWQKQLHDDSETHSEATQQDQDDSGSSSTIDDVNSSPKQDARSEHTQKSHTHTHTHATRGMDTQVIEVEQEQDKKPEMAQREMEIIELEEEEEEPHQHTGSITIETIDIDSDAEEASSNPKSRK